ncbi:hypothetical protein BG015_005178 [Linnemannia schmuckeri]|uniref:Uncharacterized protein n=1 Tax=Linnemannia schmuckeri TaxID=64567 RepID=A0A9P5S906_9FUNG|nr:hypothetical protein BG015_005178 [Linnemannia schmuckeri]
MNSNIKSAYNPSAQENKPDRVHTHNTAHSTHAFCETFDQATRDMQQNSNSASSKDSTETMAASTGHRRHSSAAKEENEESLREANSAVQFHRDVQKSRRSTDDAKQGSSTRDGSWLTNPNELPYIE